MLFSTDPGGQPIVDLRTTAPVQSEWGRHSAGGPPAYVDQRFSMTCFQSGWGALAASGHLVVVSLRAFFSGRSPRSPACASILHSAGLPPISGDLFGSAALFGVSAFNYLRQPAG